MDGHFPAQSNNRCLKEISFLSLLTCYVDRIIEDGKNTGKIRILWSDDRSVDIEYFCDFHINTHTLVCDFYTIIGLFRGTHQETIK